jgi:saccharopine dehydrogenase-like NADP-dependent oxidoreductase
MQVIIEGQKAGKSVGYTYYLLDEYDEETRTTSMARTTGYTCAIVARQMIRGMFSQEGIFPPEFVGRVAGCYDDLQAEYKIRNIQLRETITK